MYRHRKGTKISDGHVLCETELTATYEFQPVFLGFVSILENFSNGFRIQNHSGYSYFHGKEGM